MGEQAMEHRRTLSSTAAEVLAQLDEQVQTGDAGGLRTMPTGFEVLDEALGGGVRSGELLLLGGPPGVGKTIAALQWARHMARSGVRAVFVCYEHDPSQLLLRLLAMEFAESGDQGEHRALISSLMNNGDRHGGVIDGLRESPTGEKALHRFQEYAQSLILVRASGSHTTLAEVGDMLDQQVDGTIPTVLFVDYLQKIPVHPEPDNEAEKVTHTVEGLKDLALAHQVPVVLISAVDSGGMHAHRLRLHHLRGSSAVAFEADVALMLNSKEKAVSKIHLSYDPTRAKTFRDWVVMSIEKNRSGPALVDLEFRKDFAHFRFEPGGAIVSDKLVSERLDEAEL